MIDLIDLQFMLHEVFPIFSLIILYQYDFNFFVIFMFVYGSQNDQKLCNNEVCFHKLNVYCHLGQIHKVL